MKKEMNYEALQANLALLDKKAKMDNEQIKAEGNYAPKMEKLNELLGDEAFCEKLLLADDVQQAKALFAENGVELTEDQVNEFGKYVAFVSKKFIENGGELAEEDLEEVAGGLLGEASLTLSFVSAAGHSLISGGSSIAGAASTGAAAGTAGCPVVGTIIGAVVAATVVAGIVYRKEVAAGAKKLGGWVKSWF